MNKKKKDTTNPHAPGKAASFLRLRLLYLGEMFGGCYEVLAGWFVGRLCGSTSKVKN
jgi:hypothetical protein